MLLLSLISVHQLRNIINSGEKIQVLDARGDDEWVTGHIEGSLHVYVGHLEQRLDEGYENLRHLFEVVV